MKHKPWDKEKQTGSRKLLRGQSWKRAVEALSLLLVVTFGLCCIIATGGGGGSSGSGDVSALTLPGRIQLTEVEDSGSGASLSGSISLAFNDAGTDYSNQTKETWVEDINALDMVNGILGACQGSGYENFVNAGPYKALVKQVGKAEQSQGGSSSSSTTSEDLMEMTLDVTRTSNSAPMIVKIWVEEKQGPGNMPMLVRGYFEVTEGVSAQYPYGVMEAHFSGNQLNNDGTEGNEAFNMAMSIGADDNGNVLVQFIESCDEEHGAEYFQRTNKVRAMAASDFSTGKAYAYTYENSSWEGERSVTSYVAFNADYFKINDGTEKVYDKNNLARRVFRYKLFNADTGAKVTRNSGFPIQLSGGEHAYVGYWGLWAPYGVDVANGATVTKVDTGEEYTVFKVRGKLRKHSEATITLSELDGVEMCSWKDSADIIIKWNSTNQKFYKIGTRNYQTGQIEYVAATEVTFSDWEGAWCEALNAYLPLGRLYKNNDGSPRTPVNGDTLKYHKEETVTPATAADLTLYYYGYAPDAPIDQNDIDGAAAAEQAYWGGGATEKTYNFVANELMLKDGDSDEVIIPAGVDLSESMYQWGLHMCPLTEAQYALNEWWKAHDAAEYYSWETGPEEWHQFVTVIDSNDQYVAFDAPLRFTYTHSTAKDLNGDAAYDGKTFNIDYDGFELHIPWEFDDVTDQWQPIISLKDGTVLGSDYVVKATEEALFMQEAADPSAASGLIIDMSIEPPTLAYDAAKNALVGDLPASAELKVIKGELIE